MKPAIVLLAALASTASAERQQFAGMPPERYQGDGVAVVLFVSDVREYCNTNTPAGYVLIACAKKIDGVPVIVMPNPCPIGDIDFYARVACHELGHVNGWPGRHPE